MILPSKNKFENFMQTLLTGPAIISLPTHANSKLANQRQVAQQVVDTYFYALNNNDASTIVGLFHERSVYMEDNGNSMEGQNSIKNQLNALFSQIQHHATLTHSTISINGNIAIIECEAEVKLKIHETGIELPVIDHDLFVLIKINEQWKIDKFVNNGNSSYLDESDL